MVDVANYGVSGEYGGSGKSRESGFWVNLENMVDMVYLVILTIPVILVNLVNLVVWLNLESG